MLCSKRDLRIGLTAGLLMLGLGSIQGCMQPPTAPQLDPDDPPPGCYWVGNILHCPED